MVRLCINVLSVLVGFLLLALMVFVFIKYGFEILCIVIGLVVLYVIYAYTKGFISLGNEIADKILKNK